MKINTVNNTTTLSHSPTFKASPINLNSKVLTDSTIKVISAAIASIGIAGIELQREVNDYSTIFAKELQESSFTDIKPKVLEEVMETAPELMENLISKRKSNDSKRRFNTDTLKKLLEAYENNPDLTIELLNEKNKDESFKYNIKTILKILDVYNESPELFELAKEKANLIHALVNKKDPNGNALYSVEDIKIIAEALEVNPEYTSKLLAHKNRDEKPRFSGQDIKYFLLNGADRNEFLNFLINNKPSVDGYKCTPEQIITINEIKEKNNNGDYIRDLMDNIKMGYLPTSKVIDILNAESAADIVKLFPNSYYRNLIFKIFKLRNEKLSSRDIAFISEIKDKYNNDILHFDDLLRFKNSN